MASHKGLECCQSRINLFNQLSFQFRINHWQIHQSDSIRIGGWNKICSAFCQFVPACPYDSSAAQAYILFQHKDRLRYHVWVNDKWQNIKRLASIDKSVRVNIEHSRIAISAASTDAGNVCSCNNCVTFSIVMCPVSIY